MVELRQPSAAGLLIEDAWVLKDLTREMPESLSIALRGGRIVGLGPRDELRLRSDLKNAQRLSLPGYLIAPGLINAHTHASMSFFRGLGQAQAESSSSDASLIENFFFPAEKALTPELIEPLAYPYLVDALRSGTVAVADAYFFIEGVGRALDRIGMRGFIGEHVADLGGPHPAGQETWEKYRSQIEKWNFSSRVQPMVYAHATDTVSFGLLQELALFAKKEGLPFHMHLSQTQGERDRVLRREGKTPVRYAYEAGVLSERALLVHLISADPSDLALIAGEGGLVCLCPASEIIYEKLPPLGPIFASGVRLALGTDCAASNDTADVLQEARIMALLSRHEAYPQSPEALGRMVLGEAAKLLAPNELGTLKEGMAADFFCVKLGLEVQPLSRSLSNLFYSAASRLVEHVMIDGRWVLWNRELCLVSEADLAAEFNAALKTLRQRSQLPL